MTDLVLLLQADVDIQSAFERYEDYQDGRGEISYGVVHTTEPSRIMIAAEIDLRQDPESIQRRLMGQPRNKD